LSAFETVEVLVSSKQIPPEHVSRILFLFLKHCRSETCLIKSASMLRTCRAVLADKNVKHQQIFLVFDLMTSLLRKTKQTDDLSLSTEILLLIENCLHTIVISHPTSISVAFAVFRNLCTLFLQTILSVVSESSLDSSEKVNQSEKVAQSLDSLLSKLSDTQDFNQMVPDLLMTYIKLSQIHATHPTVKKTLLSSMYRIMKCLDQKSNSWKSSLTRLDQPGKILLKHLTNNHDKYFSYKGYV